MEDCCKKYDGKHTVHKKSEAKSVGTYLILGVICLLLIFSVVQTVQIAGITERVSTGAAISGVSSGQTSQISVPTRNAPTMVGGC